MSALASSKGIAPKRRWSRLLRASRGLITAIRVRFSPRPVAGKAIVLLTLTIVLSVVMVLVFPHMRQPGKSWGNPGDWIGAISLSWPALIALLLLKGIENLKHRRGVFASNPKQLEECKFFVLEAIHEIWACPPGMHPDIRRPRELLLKCIANEVADLLCLSPHDVTVSLLDFSGGGTESMTVVARSAVRRQVPKAYESRQLLAFEAIQSGRLAVCDDIRGDPRWRAAGQRGYRSVAAVPVARKGSAFGAVSVDCTQAYIFVRNGHELQMAMQPYANILALTYRPDSIQMPCDYDASQA